MKFGASLGERMRVQEAPRQPETTMATTTQDTSQDAEVAPLVVEPVTPDLPNEAPKPVTVEETKTRQQYWLRGALVTVTPEVVTLDLRSAEKPEGVAKQDSLNLAVSGPSGPIHIAFAAAPEEGSAIETATETEVDKEVPVGVQMSEGQSPSTSND